MMPGLLKVGMTRRTPEVRAAALSEYTGVPGRFSVAHSVAVEDCDRAEAPEVSVTQGIYQGGVSETAGRDCRQGDGAARFVGVTFETDSRIDLRRMQSKGRPSEPH